MKKFSIYALAAMSALLIGCSNDSDINMGDGTVTLDIAINSDVKAVSRTSSSDLADELGDSFKLWLTRTSGTAGVIRQYEGLSTLPSSLSLAAGSYVAEAWAGDSVSASFTDRWFKGSASFDVTAGNVTPVEIKCKIANVVVSVEYDSNVLDNYDVDSLYVSHKRGALSFVPGVNDRGYFMMPSSDKDLAWTFIGTRKSDGAVKTFSGTLSNVKSAYEYKFKVTFTPNVPEETHVGGAYFDINIVNEEIPVYDEQVIYGAPMIDGVYDHSTFSLDDVFSVSKDPGMVQVYVTASSEIKSLKLNCEDFTTLFGISSTSVDLIATTNSAIIGALNNGGLSWSRTSNATAQSYNALITLSESLTAAMDWEKLYSIEITATDSNDYSTTKSLRIKKTSAPVNTPAPVTDPSKLDPSMISATSYTVTGQILNNTGDDVYVTYNSASRADNTVKATIVGDTYTATLTGLTPGTKYEYTVTYGSYVSDPIAFVTESALQLPNCGFESWNTSSQAYLLYAPGEEIFWDSGNHGSATLKKNITTPDGEIKHSGNYSAKLSSQYVSFMGIGKFAAGNVFIGEYLGTDGTDGIIGFGRPFTGRPTKIRCWVKYETAEIKWSPSGTPSEFAKGNTDIGIIYAALCDATTDPEYPNYPVVVKTKTKQFFNSNASNIIAYAQEDFTESTTGSGLIEVVIPLEYRRTDIRPSFILLTASASKGGDYFAGGNSTMWIDDIELIYE